MKAHVNFNRLKLKFLCCFTVLFIAVGIGRMGRGSMIENAPITQNAQPLKQLSVK